MRKYLILVLLIDYTFVFGQGSLTNYYDVAQFNRTESYKEKVQLLQIPSPLLPQISTNDLLSICLQYPYNINIVAYDNTQMGFKSLISDFNGYSELIKREDLVDVLIETLSLFPDDIRLQKESECPNWGKISHYYLVLENIAIYTANEKYLSQRQKELFSLSIKRNLNILNNNTDKFCLLHTILYNKLEQALSSNPIRMIEDFEYWNDILIYTPNNSSLYGGRLIDDDLNYEEQLYYDTLFANYYQNILDGYSTAKYNCHGYAWHMFNNSCSDTVFFQSFPLIYTDDYSYEVTTNESEAEIITYGGTEHSARRLPNGNYISKWGIGPRFIHSKNNVPYNTNPNYMTFYRRATPKIVGAANPCGASVYYVSKIPTTATVNWSVTGLAPNSPFSLIQNSPASNQCTFSYLGYNIYSATITATVVNNGVTIATVSKQISNSFEVSFTQIGNTYNGISYSNIGPVDVSNHGTIVVNQSCSVTLSSPYINGMSVFHSGASPSSFATLGNSITFVMPYTGSEQIMYIDGTDGCHSISMTIRARSNAIIPIPTLNVMPVAGGFIFTLLSDDSSDVKSNQYGINEITTWNLVIYNVETGEEVCKNTIKYASPILINSFGWKPGVYVARAFLNKYETSCKFIVK